MTQRVPFDLSAFGVRWYSMTQRLPFDLSAYERRSCKRPCFVCGIAEGQVNVLTSESA